MQQMGFLFFKKSKFIYQIIRYRFVLETPQKILKNLINLRLKIRTNLMSHDYNDDAQLTWNKVDLEKPRTHCAQSEYKW